MEAIYHRHNFEPRQQTSRQGDWICLYCSNYNYSFRYICNRCQVQTRQSNEKTAMLLIQQQMPSQTESEEWLRANDAENQDPILDDGFPKVLFVTPPKQYLRKNQCGARSVVCRPIGEVEGLSEPDPNLSKKHHRFKQQAFEKENIRWLNKILEE